MKIRVAATAGAVALAWSMGGQGGAPDALAASFTELTGAASPFNGLTAAAQTAPGLFDMDADGDLDMFAGGADGQVRYYENTGTAQFPAFTERTGAGNPLDAVSASNASFLMLFDVNGDGDLDAFVGAGGGQIEYYENVGSPQGAAFTQRTGAANPLNSFSTTGAAMPAGADVDGDADIDVYLADGSGSVTGLENAGGVTAPSYVQLGDAANPLFGVTGARSTFADVNADGLQDYISGQSSAVVYYQNTGTAQTPVFTLQSGGNDPFSALTGTGGAAPFLADLDADGDLDLALGQAAGGLRYFINIEANLPPIANAGQDQSVNEGAPVVLNGSGSTDGDDGIAAYAWTQTGGPSVTLENANTAAPSFTAPFVNEATDLVFSLQVTDVSGQADTDTVTIRVTNSAANVGPTANAGQDITANEGSQITLDGSGSSDPDDGIATYAWTQTAGTAVNLGDGNTARQTITLPYVDADEILAFLLTVTDYAGASDNATVQVTVLDLGNFPPVAVAGDDMTVDAGFLVILDGFASYSPDGVITSYRWTQTSGPSVSLNNPTGVQTQFEAPVISPGGAILTFRLTVTDDDVLQGEDTIVVYVRDESGNVGPSADAGADKTVNISSTVALDGSSSSDPDGTIAAYAWTQTSGPAVSLSDATTSTASFTAPAVTEETTLAFQLLVTDNDGATAQDNVTVTVRNQDGNLPPTANAGSDLAVNENVLVTLNGSVSRDPEGQPLSYQWTQVSGPNAVLNNSSSSSPSFLAPQVGENGGQLIFRLVVTDSVGLTAEDTVTVSVLNVYVNTPPLANAGDIQVVTEGSSVQLNGAASQDLEGGALRYSWTQLEGPAVTLSSATVSQPQFTAPQVGEGGAGLRFQLQVTDPEGLSSQDTAWAFVTDPLRSRTTGQALIAGSAAAARWSGLAEPADAFASEVPAAWRPVWGDAEATADFINLGNGDTVAMLGPTQFTYPRALSDNERVCLAWAVDASVFVQGTKIQDLTLSKARGDGSTVSFAYSTNIDELSSTSGDAGKWTVMTANGNSRLSPFASLPSGRMIVVVYLNAGGAYDDDADSSTVTDPLLLAGPKADQKEPGGGGDDGGGGGGCTAGNRGLDGSLLLAVLGAALTGIMRRREET